MPVGYYFGLVVSKSRLNGLTFRQSEFGLILINGSGSPGTGNFHCFR